MGELLAAGWTTQSADRARPGSIGIVAPVAFSAGHHCAITRNPTHPIVAPPASRATAREPQSRACPKPDRPVGAGAEVDRGRLVRRQGCHWLWRPPERQRRWN